MRSECNANFQRILDKISGKWKMLIVWELSHQDSLRYGELKKILSPITHKMLSQNLNELEKNELINRKQYNEIPPRVEYSLTDRSKGLLPILEQIEAWGMDI